MEPQTIVGYDMFGRETFPDDEIFWNQKVTTYREYQETELQDFDGDMYTTGYSFVLLNKDTNSISNKSNTGLLDFLDERIELGDYFTLGESRPFVYLTRVIEFRVRNIAKLECTCFSYSDIPHNLTISIDFNRGVPKLVKVDPILAQQFILKAKL